MFPDTPQKKLLFSHFTKFVGRQKSTYIDDTRAQNKKTMRKEEPPAILVVLVFCVKGTFAFSVCCGVTVFMRFV